MITCPICLSKNIEGFKMKNGTNKNARVSYVGYHCHNCNRVKVFEVGTFSREGISKAFTLAYEGLRI